MAFKTISHSAALGGSVLHLKFDVNLKLTAAHCGCGCVGRLVGVNGSVGVGGSTNDGVGPRSSFDGSASAAPSAAPASKAELAVDHD